MRLCCFWNNLKTGITHGGELVALRQKLSEKELWVMIGMVELILEKLMYILTCRATWANFVAWQVVSLMKNEQQRQNLLLKVDPHCTFRSNFLQPATNISLARQVDHARWKTWRNMYPKHATKQCCITSWGFLYLVFLKLNSNVAPRAWMKTYRESRIEPRNLQIVKKMLAKSSQFITLEQPCLSKSLDVAFNITGVEKKCWEILAVAVNIGGGHSIWVLNERSVVDGRNLSSVVVVLKSVWYSVGDTLLLR